MSFGEKDTIVALSTPPLRSAIGVIRVSGEKTFEIIGSIFSKDISDCVGRTAHIGKIHDGKRLLDEAVVTVYRAPESYTGEDVAEISCHGSPLVLTEVLEAVIKNGARQAKNGEFTKRAFINGKLDLAKAEAVADLIDSQTQAEADIALGTMQGELSKRIAAVREKLMTLTAQLFAFIDYPDEDIEDVTPQKLKNAVISAKKDIQSLTETYKGGRLIKDGIRTVICGKPNVGKSLLMNRILGYDRSIVTEIAGTTRDIVDDSVVFGGVKLCVSDTAGIRETEDTVEKIGVERAEKLLAEADMVIFVYDLSRSPDSDDEYISAQIKNLKNTVKIAVLNKTDLASPTVSPQGFDAVVAISAAKNEGIDLLENAVAAAAKGIFPKSAGIITNARQYECLVRADEMLSHAEKNINMTADAIVTDIEGALEALGGVDGKTVGEEIVETVFSRFCVGK